jgi:hypothetical protein
LADCVVADAVLLEPVSKAEFLVNREKNRDFDVQWVFEAVLIGGSANKLGGLWPNFPKWPNRDALDG